MFVDDTVTVTFAAPEAGGVGGTGVGATGFGGVGATGVGETGAAVVTLKAMGAKPSLS